MNRESHTLVRQTIRAGGGGARQKQYAAPNIAPRGMAPPGFIIRLQFEIPFLGKKGMADAPGDTPNAIVPLVQRLREILG